MNNEIDVILTRYRRPHLKRQLAALRTQTLRPTSVTIFQNDFFRRGLVRTARRNRVEFAWSSRNTKHFGRFAHALTSPSEYVAILDDDIIPGARCLEAYLHQVRELDAIIGGNGRIAEANPNREHLTRPAETGVRSAPIAVDFVGHLWVLRREWLHAMFAIPPFTWETGEDMHLCFSAKMKLGIRSFAGAQRSRDEFADTADNALAVDRHASHRQPTHDLRPAIENYFIAQGHRFIETN